jgi:hypothetical protein
MYRRGILIHCPPEFSVDIVPPVKEGSSWHYGLRVKSLAGSSPGGAPVDAKGKRVKGYEIHRKWEDCLDLQRILEREYTALAKARKGKQGGKKGNSVYGHLQRAASFDSLPIGPDPKTIPTDIHAFIPRLAAKSSMFRGVSGSALVQQRSEEFNEFISALFAPGVPVLIDEARQSPAVREWFGFWRRDRDAMRRRDGDRASIASSTQRLSISSSEASPLPKGGQDTSTSPFTSSPLAQTSYESTPISLDNQEPRQSYETTYGDLASALDTFPMPPTPVHGPVTLEPQSFQSTQPAPSLGGFVPIVQRRLGLVQSDTARRASFRKAQFFTNLPASSLPPVPMAFAASEGGGYESDPQHFEALRRSQAPPRMDGIDVSTRTRRPRRATSPSTSSASTTFTHHTPLSASPRSSQTSDWSTALSSSIVQSLAGSGTGETVSERNTPVPNADEQSEIEYMRRMSLSSLSSSSSKRPPIPPRSSLRRSTFYGASHHTRKQSNATAKSPVPTVAGEVPAVVYDEEEPEFEIVTHTVLNSYLEDARLSLLSSECAISSNSGSSIRRSMTPSIASVYSTSSAGRDSTSSPMPSSASAPPASLRVPTPSTAVAPTFIPNNEIVLKAVCPVGDSIVLCRVSRTASLQAVRRMLATKFQQAAGVELNLLRQGFVLGYLGQQLQLGRPGTAGGRPGTAGGHSGMPPVTPMRTNGRPGTAPGGRARSSSLSSMAAHADPTHLTLIVTQRDWESAVAMHGERMTVRVLLAGVD